MKTIEIRSRQTTSAGFLILLMGLLGVQSEAQAVDARVLPAGRSRFGYNFARTGQINATYNSDGDRRGITDPYNLRLEAEALKNADQKIMQAFNSLASTGVYYDPSRAGDPVTGGVTTTNTGINLANYLEKGDLGVRADAQRTQHTFSLQHGITDQISIGLMVPIIKTQVRTRAELTNSPKLSQLKSVMSSLGNTSIFEEIYTGLAYLDDANMETLQKVLTDQGYKRFEDGERNGIGDIVFGGRYNYLKTRQETWISSAQLGIEVPTGELKDVSVVTDVDNGQGAWAIGLGHITNFNPKMMESKWMFSHSLNYTHRLPSSRMYRVKETPNEVIPSSKGDEEIDMQLGDKIWTTLGAQFRLSKVVSFETNYEWYWKMTDHYSGSRPRDYTYLSEDTDLYLETLNLGASISTIPLFLNKKFPLPLDFNFNYYRPIQGKNAVIAPFGTAEIAMYF